MAGEAKTPYEHPEGRCSEVLCSRFPRSRPQHNHLTRDIKDRGVCVACDYYWDRVDEANDD